MARKGKSDIKTVEARPVEIVPASDVAGLVPMKTVSVNMYGIDDFKDLWVFLLSLGAAIKSSVNDDGKVNIKDAMKFWDPVKNLPSVISGYQNIGREVFDLTEDEINELIGAARQYVTEDVRDMVIELSELALHIVSFYGRYFYKAVSRV